MYERKKSKNIFATIKMNSKRFPWGHPKKIFQIKNHTQNFIGNSGNKMKIKRDCIKKITKTIIFICCVCINCIMNYYCGMWNVEYIMLIWYLIKISDELKNKRRKKTRKIKPFSSFKSCFFQLFIFLGEIAKNTTDMNFNSH